MTIQPAMRSIESDRKEQSGMIEAIATWCESLQGHVPLQDALRQLALAIGAEAAALTRLPREAGGVARSLIFDRRQARDGDRLALSHAAEVLGRHVATARLGTIWFQSMCEMPGDGALRQFQQRRHLRELAVIPLSLADKTIDVLELHFSDRLQPGDSAMLNMMLGTLTRTWARRSNGLFAEAIMRPQARAEAAPRVPILSIANPARLSRAEYRVCHLLRQGLSTTAVQNELCISASTLRTHLRNIHAKTGTNSLSVLMYHLLATPQEDSDTPALRVA